MALPSVDPNDIWRMVNEDLEDPAELEDNFHVVPQVQEVDGETIEMTEVDLETVSVFHASPTDTNTDPLSTRDFHTMLLNQWFFPVLMFLLIMLLWMEPNHHTSQQAKSNHWNPTKWQQELKARLCQQELFDELEELREICSNLDAGSNDTPFLQDLSELLPDRNVTAVCLVDWETCDDLEMRL